MGRFLRAEVAAGRSYLPQGDRILRPSPGPWPTSGCWSSARIRTPPWPCGGAQLLGGPRRRPLPGSLRNIVTELGNDVGGPPPANGDLTPWADRGVLCSTGSSASSPARPPPTGARAGSGSPSARSRPSPSAAVRRPRSSGAASPHRRPAAGPGALGGLGAPVPAVGLARLLRVPPLQQGQRPAGPPGRPASRLVPGLTFWSLCRALLQCRPRVRLASPAGIPHLSHWSSLEVAPIRLDPASRGTSRANLRGSCEPRRTRSSVGGRRSRPPIRPLRDR